MSSKSLQYPPEPTQVTLKMEARHSSQTTEQTNDPTHNNLAACQYSNEDLKTSNMI